MRNCAFYKFLLHSQYSPPFFLILLVLFMAILVILHKSPTSLRKKMGSTSCIFMVAILRK